MHLLHAIAVVIALLISPCAAQSLSRSSWYALASSSEYPLLDAPSKVLDGSDASKWHSAWEVPFDALPHTISIFFGGDTNTVNGLIYRPRLDGPNGRIGKFEVRISTNGETFPSGTVATGTFADTATQKVVSFTAVKAKGIQLKALTEAGNRGPWSSAGEILVRGTTATAAPKNAVGTWGPLIPFPLVPVAAALLPNGKVRSLSPPWSLVLPQSPWCHGGCPGL
jgi:galactose oxidase